MSAENRFSTEIIGTLDAFRCELVARRDDYCILRCDKSIFLVRVNNWGSEWATLALGTTVHTSQQVIEPFKHQRLIGSKLFAAFFGFTDKTVVVLGDTKLIEIPVLTEPQSLAVWIDGVSEYHGMEIKCCDSRVYVNKDIVPKAGKKQVTEWIQEVNKAHFEYFYESYNILTHDCNDGLVTLRRYKTADARPIYAHKAFLPELPQSTNVFYNVPVRRSVIAAAIASETAKEVAAVLRYEHKENCTEVAIGDARVTIPVDRDVHALMVRRDVNGALGAQKVRAENVTHYVIDSFTGNTAGVSVMHEGKRCSIPFDDLRFKVNSINKAHRERFYLDCRVIYVADDGLVTLRLPESEGLRMIYADKALLPKFPQSTTKFFDIPVRRSVIAAASERYDFMGNEIKKSAKVRLPVITYYDEKSTEKDIHSDREKPGDTVVKIGDHVTFHWSNTRSPFIPHEAKVSQPYSKDNYNVMVNGDNGLSVSVFKSADKQEASKFAKKLDFKLAKIDQERAAKYYAECEVASVDYTKQTAVVRRKSDGFRYEVKLDDIPDGWRVSQGFLVALTALTHLADPINCSKNNEKLSNPCLEARPNIKHDDLLIYSHASRIQREGKPYYARAVMCHTKDLSGFEIQINQQKWILKHSANILRVHRVGETLQLDVGGKNPRYNVYVEVGSRQIEVFSSSCINDMQKARAFVDGAVGEINSQLQSLHKWIAEAKALADTAPISVTQYCFAGAPGTGMSYGNNTALASLMREAAEKEAREYVPKILGGAGVQGNLYKEMVFESGTVFEINRSPYNVKILNNGKPVESLSMAQVVMIDKEIARSTLNATDMGALSLELDRMCLTAGLCRVCSCHAPGTPGFNYESCLCTDSADVECLAEHPKAIICCPCVKQAVQNYLYDASLDKEASDDDLPPLEPYTDDDEPEPTCVCERICYGCGGASEASSSAASSKKLTSHDFKVGQYEFSYYPDTRIFFMMGSSMRVPEEWSDYLPSCVINQDFLKCAINSRGVAVTLYGSHADRVHVAQKVGRWLLELYTRGVFK